MSERWQVVLDREPQKFLRKANADLRRRLLARLHELELNPRPSGSTKLASYENLYRVRVGDWRITYAIKDELLIVLVIEIAPRGDAYRNL